MFGRVMAKVGANFEGYVPIAGSRIPLREGVWIVLADIRSATPSGAQSRCFLGQIKYGRLQSAVAILSAIGASTQRPSYPKLSFRENELYRIVEQNEENGSQSCWVIHNLITWPWKSYQDKTTGISELEGAAAERMNDSSIFYPREFLISRFVCREHTKLIQADYFMNPELAGIELTAEEVPSWRQSDFAPGNIRKHADKYEFFRQTVGWCETWWPGFKSCFAEFRSEGF